MVRAQDWDIVLLDIAMPDKSGVEVLKQIKREKPKLPVLILSMHPESRYAVQLLRSGANGYLLKDGPARHLFDAINYVQDGGQYLTPLIRREVLDNKREQKDALALLSKREFEVFSFLVDGMRPKDIAKTLEISPKTVDTYRANIMRKLEVDGIAGLVRFAIQRNLQSNSTPC